MFFKKMGFVLFACLLSLWTALALAAVEVNTATLAQLDGIKGIGPATSQKIMAARQTAPFKDWTDFQQRVKGIHSKKATALSQAGLTVNGAAFNGNISKPKYIQ